MRKKIVSFSVIQEKGGEGQVRETDIGRTNLDTATVFQARGN